MKLIKNEGFLDRSIRIVLAEIFFLLGFFWLSGPLQIVSYAFFVAMLFTGFFGFCSLYKVFGINTNKNSGAPISKLKITVLSIVIVLVAVLGAYASNFFTKKLFLDDYSRMNNYYKQTLFYTGQVKREESVMNYDLLVSEYTKFSNKYSKYRPYAISGDEQFSSDIAKVSDLITGLRGDIYAGDLASSHTKLEEVRPIFKDILARNGFSLLAVALVEFHDSMEMVIDPADVKDAQGVILNYVDADEKLKAVEEIVNDEEIQVIRKNLDGILKLAQDGKREELSAKAAELKSSFVKVYLKRG